MTILMTENKDLLVTKRSNVYKYETGVDNIKFLVPQELNDVQMSDLSMLVIVMMTVNGEKKGLFKYLDYEEEPYKDHLVSHVPITTMLTREVGTVRVGLLFLKPNPENPKLADNVLQTRYTSFNVEDGGSYANSETRFDEIWEHASIDTLHKNIDDMNKKIDSKADTIELQDGNIVVLRSGDKVLASVKLEDNVEWKEWI